ncbi:MAG: DUF6575 domain-containing protein [Candidatus Ozemobacteraceae bacterium]
MTGNVYFNPRETSILEIYSYYDAPMLFLAQGRFTQQYMAIVVGDDECGLPNKWVYCPISPEKLSILKSGKKDLHSAFFQPEMGFVLEVGKQDDSTYSVRTLKPGDQTSEKLLEMGIPEPGVLLPKQDFLNEWHAHIPVYSSVSSSTVVRNAPDKPARRFDESSSEHSSNERLSEAA